jgi:hypothetical protein
MGAGERRRLIVLCSVLGVVVVLFVGRLVFFSGGGSKSSSSTLPIPTLAAGSGSVTTPTTAPSSRSTRTPATFDVFATKNPFEPVIIVTPPDGGGSGGTTPTSDTTPGDTTPSTGGGSGGTGGTGTTTTTQLPSNEPAPGTSVALLDVFQDAGGTPMAKVQVGSTVYTVGADDVFATSYRVVSLNAPCGQFLFGDAPFKLCEGEEVIK